MDKIDELLKDPNIVNIMNAVSNRYNRSIDRDGSREFMDILIGLPEDVSNILKQRYLGNMTMVEIAEANGYSRETARRRLKRAVNLCRKSNCQLV